ncbi:pentapeptide repeat-containing protein [Streptomyces sp. NPDC059037]|uniref:pentapeptide repeat-containing protein n=1 Tax=Streptomyces sp. NPDC059037 TaxID=3346710 RepID=UPI00367A727E
MRRVVRVMPADPEAAAELQSWSQQQDTTLDLSGLDASGADLTGAHLALGVFSGTGLKRTTLVDTDLYRAHLEDAVLDSADLTGASLAKAVLDGASLRSANLTRADLSGTKLTETDATSAVLRGARLNGTVLAKTCLRGADLTDATLHNTSFDAVLDEETILQGLTGSVFGPAHVDEGGSVRELAGLELEFWLESRGASVNVLNSPPGTVTFYAHIDDEFPRERPAGIVRRRRAGQSFRDEAFTRNLRWEPTEYLRLYELGHNDSDHVEITEEEANRFVTRITAKLGGSQPL